MQPVLERLQARLDGSTMELLAALLAALSARSRVADLDRFASWRLAPTSVTGPPGAVDAP